MLFFAIYAFSLAAIARSNVIGLDFGSDSMKIGIVQPGMPLGKHILQDSYQFHLYDGDM